MIEQPTIDVRHDLRFVSWTGAAASGAFLLLAFVTTQVDEIAAVVPFTDDPYDAVTWFSVFATAIVVGATIVRALGHRSRPYDVGVARRIALGWSIAIVLASIAVLSDLWALVVVGVPPRSPGVAIAIELLALAGFDASLGLAAIWRARSTLRRPPARVEPEPDLIDEATAIVGAVGARGLATRLSIWIERSPLSPRRHRIAVGVLGAAVAGVGAVAWHAWREGAWASPGPALLFGSVMAVFVMAPYLLCLEPLRLVRAADPTGTG